MNRWFLAIGAAAFFSLPLLAQNPAAGTSTSALPANTTILIIRHAEKPDFGAGLTPTGVAHAKAYVTYFENYRIDGKPVKIDALFAAADSDSSQRPRLTLKPLSHALGLPIDTRFKDKDYTSLAQALAALPPNKTILICWHHGRIPDLLDALGADSAELLPNGKWPSDEYDWVLQLRYDPSGRLQQATRLEQTAERR